MPPAQDTVTLPRRELVAVAIVAAVVVALAAFRATVGASFYDDTFYAAVPWRFAHGARFMIDELSFQTVAEMVSVPLVWLWERLFGLTGLVLAIRLLWVAIASAGGVIAVRLLRGTARVAVAGLALAVVLLAPAYNVFAPTYNTVSSLLLVLATLLGFAAARDGSARLAAWCGAAIALGAAAYPPLAPAAVVLLATFVVVARDRRLALWAAGAALVAAGAAVAALFAGVSADDVRLALSFGSANVASFGSPAAKLSWVLGNTGRALASPWLVPMWLLAVVASVPRVPARLRTVALGLVPLAAALPSAVVLSRGDLLTWGASTQSWLITLCAGALVPSLLAARRLGRADLLRLAALAAPFSAVGYLVVAYVTNSSWNRGMPAIALAPLAVAVLLAWGTSLAEEGGTLTLAVGAALTLAVAFVLLFANVFGAQHPFEPLERIRTGAYAGLLATPTQRAQTDELMRQSRQWVGPETRVTFVGQAEAYLAVGGTPLTPATWLFLGKADGAAIDYFRRVGRTPDVVFVSNADVANAGGWDVEASRDPMLGWVEANYSRAGEAGGFRVFTRR